MTKLLQKNKEHSNLPSAEASMKSKFIYGLVFLLISLCSCEKGESNDELIKSKLKEGLVAYYPFNGNAHDESGNNYHLTNKGAILTRNRFNQENKAFHFNGTDASMDVPALSGAGQITDFTISLWVRADELQPSGHMMSFSGKENNVSSSLHMLLKNQNQSYFSVNSILSFNTETALAKLGSYDHGLSNPVGRWVNILLGQQQNSTFLYIDGQQVLVKPGSIAPLSFIKGFVGCYAPTTGIFEGLRSGFFSGDLDEIRIYDRALAEEEIQQLFKLSL
jgi:hypothetical protein